jgi:acyl phosphate:glycerol-3-phosphate acyltransferase
MIVPLLTAIIIGYLLGSIPFGYLVARSKGINIFEHGSKNPGATNVRRVLGKGPGNLVFFLDVLKGAAAAGWPLLLAWRSLAGSSISLGTTVIYSNSAAWPMAIVGLLAALLGHCFSCFTGFRGGKGVATTVGGVLVLMPAAIGIAAIIWVLVFYTLRYVSLASILAALTLPVAAFFLGQPSLLIWLAIAIAVLVLLRHRANIVRLLNGTENRFSKKK